MILQVHIFKPHIPGSFLMNMSLNFAINPKWTQSHQYRHGCGGGGQILARGGLAGSVGARERQGIHSRGFGWGRGGEGSRRVVSNGALGSAAVRQGRTCEVRPERLSGSWATHSGGYLRRRMDEGWWEPMVVTLRWWVIDNVVWIWCISWLVICRRRIRRGNQWHDVKVKRKVPRKVNASRLEQRDPRSPDGVMGGPRGA